MGRSARSFRDFRRYDDMRLGPASWSARRANGPVDRLARHVLPRADSFALNVSHSLQDRHFVGAHGRAGLSLGRGNLYGLRAIVDHGVHEAVVPWSAQASRWEFHAPGYSVVVDVLRSV